MPMRTFSKKIANMFLLGAVVLFILVLIIMHYIQYNFWLRLLRFAAEAAVVGGIADWFAVTAVFKNPLPSFIPQPHTALIPKNREKIKDSVARLVEEELLSVQVFQAKLRETPLAKMILEYLEKEKGLDSLALGAANYLVKVVARVDCREVAIYLDKYLKNMLRDLRLTPIFARYAADALENGLDEKWLDWFLERISPVLASDGTREWLYKQLLIAKQEKVGGNIFKRWAAEIGEHLNMINLGEASVFLQVELLRLCSNLKEPGNELRIKLRLVLRDMTVQLGKNLSWWRTIEDWKEELVDEVNLRPTLEELVSGVLNVLTRPGEDLDDETIARVNSIYTLPQNWVRDERSLLVQWLSAEIRRYLENLKDDEGALERLNQFLQEALTAMIASGHYLIGTIVRNTLDSFDDEKLNDFIYDKVGSDLQGIRVNGVLVGGIIGAFIFLFLNFIYDPLVSPLILTIWPHIK